MMNFIFQPGHTLSSHNPTIHPLHTTSDSASSSSSSTHYLQTYRLFVFNFKLNFLVELSLNFIIIINAFTEDDCCYFCCDKEDEDYATRQSVMNIPGKPLARNRYPSTTATGFYFYFGCCCCCLYCCCCCWLSVPRINNKLRKRRQ